MWGADDPTNRKPLLWEDLEPYDSSEDRVDREMLAWYRKVFSMRAAHAALRTGSFRTLLVDDAEVAVLPEGEIETEADAEAEASSEGDDVLVEQVENWSDDPLAHGDRKSVV